MNMGAALRCELTSDPFLASIFKKTEKRLKKKTEYQAVLEELAPKGKMNEYRSAVDFVFCQLFPSFREHCFLFYEREGPPLREKDCATQDRIEKWDDYMARVLDGLVEQKERFSSWGEVIDECEEPDDDLKPL